MNLRTVYIEYTSKIPYLADIFLLFVLTVIDETVGKLGKDLPNFLLEAARLKTSFQNRDLTSDYHFLKKAKN